MRKLILFIFVFSFYSVVAQDQGRFWYFGENAGLDFSTTPPTALNDGALNTIEGCSTISDDLGNLLFYTDGVSVWDRNHTLMPNGSGLLGSQSASQHMIVKDKTTTNRYIILTTGAGSSGLSYSVIDMSLNNGFGDIINGFKNIIINANAFERITAYVDQTTITPDWIVTFDNSNFYTYRLISGSVGLTPRVSTVSFPNTFNDFRGFLKFSPDGNKLVLTVFNSTDKAFLLDFNQTTGVVSNPVELTTGTIYDKFYGAEFSPDSRFVYLDGNSVNTFLCTNTTNQKEIFQFAINQGSNWNSNPIALGAASNTTSIRGSLQLGPDGKIYLAKPCRSFLSVIQSPTVLGTGAGYINDAIPLASNTQSRQGLPQVPLQNYVDTFNSVQGNIIYDSDNNGCTTIDPTFPNIFLTHFSANYNSYSITNDNGEYLGLMPNGQFTVTPRPENPTYWNFSPSNVVVDFPTQASPFTQDFCVTANGTVEDLEVFVLPIEQARPGFDTDYKVVVKNKGNQTASGAVTLDFEEDFMTLLSTNPIAGNTPTNQLSWSFTGLQPFQIEEYEFSMTMNTPTQTTNPLNDGDMLTFTGTVTGTGTDAMPADNVMVFDQTVVNSYDPNDKTCLEGETIEPTDVGEYVHYMIRFENTGTASAINVVVKDEIDLSQFDITTLIPLGGSHDYYTRIREGNVVEFIHENINLDFNDATNDGYVLFKIKTLNTLVAGDTFDNTAEIFFDFNFPIVTNTETVTVMSTASIGEATDISITVYPNPAKDFINLSASNRLESATIMDMNGRMLSQTNFTGSSTEQQISIENLNAGIYFVTIQSEVGQKVEKLIVE